ncbi:protein of unknown function [Methylorubrum extorquens DM4]|uniref:Uncharacterized protein n=1 Tax=Methylorubrum extorquens (strain DSM 6343 / CIP 106787 / DM4) TaxID=661410 RepID=C7C9B4_METED|nr:hypothetical protein [Methylorubrum extorquens]CAX22080.1 protein of unknown function [Methylorubrum extorquens DM4]
MTQPQTSPAPAETLDLSFDLAAFFPEEPADLGPSPEGWDALMRQMADAEIHDLPLPECLLPLHDEPLDLSF